MMASSPMTITANIRAIRSGARIASTTGGTIGRIAPIRPGCATTKIAIRSDDAFFAYDYYREYQGDTVWRENSFNDWWHDRPDRAYPAWMRNNQNCDPI